MTIALPPGFRPATFALRQSVVQRVSASPFGGSEQILDLLQDRWMASLALSPCRPALAASREAFINAMRGQTQVCYLHHFARPRPRGTMRGAPTAQAAGVSWDSLLINTVPGASLLPGDMIGVSGLLLQARAQAVAGGDGVLQVPLVNRLRKAIPAGQAVVWDRPAAPFRLLAAPAVQYGSGFADSLSLDFAEAVDL